jgi:hypothetical protein
METYMRAHTDEMAMTRVWVRVLVIFGKHIELPRILTFRPRRCARFVGDE